MATSDDVGGGKSYREITWIGDNKEQFNVQCLANSDSESVSVIFMAVFSQHAQSICSPSESHNDS